MKRVNENDDTQPNNPASSMPPASVKKPSFGKDETGHRSTQEILDQLADDYIARIRAGEEPTLEEYTAQYPELIAEIHEVLSSVQLIEDLKIQQETMASGNTTRFEKVRLEKIGDYRTVREIGRGGMGIVFESIHESLEQKVAIKLLPSRSLEGDNSLLRFRREARAAARLHHPHIVNVFGVGQQDGYHYYVMELVNGCTLADCLPFFRKQSRFDKADQPFNFSTNRSTETSTEIANVVPSFPDSTARYRWSAEKISMIADALSYSHSNQVLHRDIKPGNILVDENQKPWITDFGLVKELSNPSMTGTGDIFGTPQYLAPESLDGKYDQRSEVYCLGLTLYELIALQPAYSGNSPTQIFNRISSSDPKRLRQIDHHVPSDLETIVHRAIDRDPNRRYPTAGEFRDDLQRFCSGLPIQSRRVLPVERLYLWSRRNPLVSSLTLLSAVLLIIVTVVSSLSYFFTEQALTDLAEKHAALQEANQIAEAARDLAKHNESRMRQEFVRAEANVDLSMQAFDRLFVKIMTRGVGRDLKANLQLETFSELSTLESSVTAEDAQILQGAIDFYEQFVEQNQDNEKLRIEIAKAYRRIANTYHFLGSFASSQKGYQKAIETYQSIVESNPNDLVNVVNLAETHNELGLAYRKQGKLQLGMKEHEKARSLLEQEIYDSASSIQYCLVNTLIQLCSFSRGPQLPGGPSGWRDKIPDVRRSIRQAMAEFIRLVPKRTSILRQAEKISGKLLERDSANPDYRFQRARLYQTKATIFGVDGDTEVEIKQLEESVKELESLISDFPDNPAFRFTLAHVFALPIRKISREAQIDRFLKTTTICRELVEDYPSVIEYLDLFASSSHRLGSMFLLAKNHERAIEALEDAKSALQNLTRKTPFVSTYYFQYTATTRMLAQAYKAENLELEARKELQDLLRFIQSSSLMNRNRPRKLEMLDDIRDELRKLREQD